LIEDQNRSCNVCIYIYEYVYLSLSLSLSLSVCTYNQLTALGHTLGNSSPPWGFSRGLVTSSISRIFNVTVSGQIQFNFLFQAHNKGRSRGSRCRHMALPYGLAIWPCHMALPYGISNATWHDPMGRPFSRDQIKKCEILSK